MNYQDFILQKSQLGGNSGFEPEYLPDWLYGFQRELVRWAVNKGRAAIFADCGLGKTPMQLVWAENVYRKTGKPVLILTPLAVAPQTVREAHKFGIEAAQSRDGKIEVPIVVTNYQRLHYFDKTKFAGVVCDESSILKNFDGVTKDAVTEFMRMIPYRLLCTATAAPNDYIELGTSSEALGELGFMDMLNRFFKKAESTISRSDEFRAGIYRFRGHAEHDFWRWVCSWARAVRNPSDLGFENNGFQLPELKCVEHIVKATTKRDDWLFDMPAITLQEQRAERRRTINERCEYAAELISNHEGCSIAWCHLNSEGDTLQKLIPGSVQVSGDDSDEWKEMAVEWFQGYRCTCGETQCSCGHKSGKRVLISKPTMFGYGLNLQCCNHMTFFPSHSFEQWYQAVRRCWRFGQKNPVKVDVIASEGESGVLSNLNRKAVAADEMFKRLVALINNELKIQQVNKHVNKQENPSWL